MPCPVCSASVVVHCGAASSIGKRYSGSTVSPFSPRQAQVLVCRLTGSPVRNLFIRCRTCIRCRSSLATCCLWSPSARTSMCLGAAVVIRGHVVNVSRHTTRTAWLNATVCACRLVNCQPFRIELTVRDLCTPATFQTAPPFVYTTVPGPLCIYRCAGSLYDPHPRCWQPSVVVPAV